MNTYNSKNDFDDEFLKHQTKKQFKDRLPTDHDRKKLMRSSFIDCFTGDSVINPTVHCPPGANCVKNNSYFANTVRCPPGMQYSTETYNCVPSTVYNTTRQQQSKTRERLAKNRKEAFFNSVVE